MDTAFDETIGLLRASQTVAIGTETVYGLFGRADDPEAVARIFEAKGRPAFNPLIAHVSGLDMAERVGHFGRIERELIEAFWPGPFTLVTKRLENGLASDLACAGLDTVAIRHAAAPFLSSVIRELEAPLAGPSANRSGHVSATSADAVQTDLDGLIPLIIDTGPCDEGIESTIVRVIQERVLILRPGSITAEMIENAVGCPVFYPDTEDASIIAPGQMTSHYAPNSDVILNATSSEPGQIYLAFGATKKTVKGTAYSLSPSGDLREAAANLYSLLRKADSENPEQILVAPIPDIGLGAAINDRLRRAAAPRH